MTEKAAAPATRLDLLHGAPAIARFLGIKPRTVYHLAEIRAKTGKGWPISNLPGMGLIASRAQLRATVEAQVGPVDEISD